MIYSANRNSDRHHRKSFREEVTSNVDYGRSVVASCTGMGLKGIPEMENIIFKKHRDIK